MDPMIRLESGGNPRAVNRRTGATGLRQFMPAALQAAGVYQPAGADGWAGAFNIPGHAGVRTRADFMANPQAQEAVHALHRRHLLREAERRGVTRLAGQTVAGTVIDEDAIVRAMHFAGPSGGARFLLTGGQHNPSDGNLRVDEYLRRTAGGGAPGGVPAGFENVQMRSVRAPAPAAAPAAPAPDNAAITAQMQAQLAEIQARQKMARVGQTNGAPSLVDALLLLAGAGTGLALGGAFRR
jgi:hypothetical protein